MQNWNNSQDFKFKVGDSVKVARKDESGLFWERNHPNMNDTLEKVGIVKECALYKKQKCYIVSVEPKNRNYWYPESSLDLISENPENNEKKEKDEKMQKFEKGDKVRIVKKSHRIVNWLEILEDFLGKTGEVNRQNPSGSYRILFEDGACWSFDPESLELVESSKVENSETKKRKENMQKDYKFEDFQIGEVVRVKSFEECMKFKNVDGYNFLYDDCARKEHCGKTVQIKEINIIGEGFMVKESLYSFHFKWLEKIEPSEVLQKSEPSENLNNSESSQDAQNSKSLGELYEELYNEVYTLEGKLIEETQSVRKCIPLDLNFKLDVSSGGDTWEIQHKSKKLVSAIFDECEVLESLEIWEQFIGKFPTFLKICRDEQKKCESLICRMIQKCKDFKNL